MHETSDDLLELQRTLDASHARAGEHLRSIFRPERRLSAEQVVQTLRGVFVLHLATVTAACEPVVAPIDGLFYRGHLWFSVPPGAVRIRHLRERPQVSGAYTRGEERCVLAHGAAREVSPAEPRHVEFTDYCREVYGSAWDHWQDHYRDREGSSFTAWIEPRRMFAAAMGPETPE